MTREYRYVGDIETGEFLYGGTWPPYDPASGLSQGQAVAVMTDRAPDLRKERYSATASQFRRQATAQEIAAYDAAQKDAMAQEEYRVDLMALAAALFKAQTGKFPNAQQAAQLKADFITARKALS